MISNKLLVVIIIVTIIVTLILYSSICVAEIPRFVRLNKIERHELLNIKHTYLMPHVSSQHIIVSLSTIPQRLDLLHPTLASLMTQNVYIDEININIPYISRKGLPYEIPTWLQELHDSPNHNIIIHRVKKDEGPATKLLPTLRRASRKEPGGQHRMDIDGYGNLQFREINSTIIIVVDDDMIYHSHAVWNLYKSYVKYGKKHAITNFGVTLDKNYKLMTDTNRIMAHFGPSKEVDILNGFGGFLVTSHGMFPDQVYDLESGPIQSISVDDVWFSGWLRHNSIKIMSAPRLYSTISIPVTSIRGKTPSLGGTENKEFVSDYIVLKWFRDVIGLKTVYDMHAKVE